MQHTNIISYANIIHPKYKGFRARFTFNADCGREHTATAEEVWTGDHYFKEVRHICCADVEDDCPDSETVTEVQLIHPDRKNEQRKPKRQTFNNVPNFGETLGS